MEFLKSLIKGVLFLILLDGISSSSGFSLLAEKNSGLDNKNPVEQLPSNAKPEDLYFRQVVDQLAENSVHFLWKQRYWNDTSYYETGGPVYLMLADRTTLNKNVMRDGYWFKHGKTKKAVFFYITHRFYDPDHDGKYLLSSETDNLKYLNVKQALADYAAFIRGMNEECGFSQDSIKWIVFGSGYAGNLAVWLRSEYPDLVHAAVASSAPVLAKMDIPEYLDNVGKALAKHSRRCKNDIAAANKDLDKLFESSKGREKIGEMFKICEPLNGEDSNIAFFAMNTVKFISNAVQNDFEYAKVKKICDKMLENVKTKKPIERYSTVIKMLMDEQKQKCISSKFDDHVQSLQVVDKTKAVTSGRLWLHQLCNEFGWFTTSRQKSCIFSKKLNVNYFLNLCSKVFASEFDEKFVNEAVATTNKSHKGQSLDVARTLFINGDADPWNFAQITSKKKNKNVDIITIKKGSHCSDINYANSKKKEMVDAIKKIEKKLDSYLEK